AGDGRSSYDSTPAPVNPREAAPGHRASRCRAPSASWATHAPCGPLAQRPRHGGDAAQRPRRPRVVASRPPLLPAPRRLAALRARIRSAPGVDPVVAGARYSCRALDRRGEGARRLGLHRALRLGRTTLDARDARALRLSALRLGPRGARRALRPRLPRARRVQYRLRHRADATLVVAAAQALAPPRPPREHPPGGGHGLVRLALP